MRNFGRDDPPQIPTGSMLTVGRERELALIGRLIEETVGGAACTLIVDGEAGIGKSRLLADARQLMRDAGGLAVLGRCLDERGTPPFFPWIDALNDLDAQLRTRPDLLDQAPAYGSLAAVLLDAEPDPLPGVAAEQRAFRQIVALSRALAKVASATPMLIAFDDLQWSDPASNQLLRYVASALVDAPVALVGAYRTEEAEPNRELRRTLDELDRQRVLTVLHLRPIDEEATRQLVDGLLGRPAPALGSAIHRQADGNPFAIEEIARAIATDERLATSMLDPAWLPEPASVPAMIRRRVDRLAPAARELLGIAALTGREISIDLVRRVSGLAPEQLAESFDAAAQAGLIDALPDQPDRAYQFRHDRIRETVAAGINPLQRQALHARLAAAVRESQQFRDRLERPALLLHHLMLAGAREEAADAAEQLGSEAMQAHAFDQAADAFRIALDLRRAGIPVMTAGDEARLLLRRGDALLAASHPDTIAVLVEAERCALTAGDPVLVGRARLRRGRAHARREEHQLAVDALRAARESFAKARRRDREALLADGELVAILGTSLGAYREAIEIGERALATVATRPADPALEALVRLELAKTLMRAGQLTAGEAQLAPALSLALGAGALDLAAEISGAQANHAYWTGRLDLSERAARHRRDYASQAGDPFAMRHARSWLATIAIARGDWAVARGLINEARADVERIDSPEPAAFLNQLLGIIALTLGQFDDAISSIEQAIAGFRQVGPATLPWYIGVLAHAYEAAGDLAAADHAVRDTEQVIAALPEGALPVAPALAQLGIVAVLRHDVAASDRLYRALLRYEGQFHWVLIDRVLGMLARTTGDLAAAERHLATAAGTALREGMRPEHALSMAGRAFDAARANDNERSRADLDQAIARLRALGMEGAIRRLELLTGAGRTEPATGRPVSLTERELGVLRLVAKGLTNREIGEQLHISEKTVINHLTHIYTKAGIENRAGAVMFAVRNGLLSG